MATYIVLWNWTDEGIRTVKKSPERVEAFKKLVEKAGGKVEAFYYTIGEYDGAARVEVPSDEAWMKVALGLGMLGNVRTKSLKAWSAAEGAKVIAQL